MNKLSIIIPVYFNEKNLPITYVKLREEVLIKLPDYELIFVDDGSADDSYEVMKSLQEKDSRIKLIKLSRNFGSHAAIFAGLENCSGDCATIIAADLQEDPNIILQMFQKWQNGSKVILAVRNGREEGYFQKLLANIYYQVFRRIAIKDMPPTGFDCFLIDKQVVNVLSQLEEKNSTIMGQVLWCGFKRDMVHYVRRSREIGTSRWTLSKKIKLFIDSILSFSYFPIRLVSISGIIAFVISFVLSMLLIVERIFGHVPIKGWTSLMILQMMFFGIEMLVMGLLGEYIWRALDASRKRPIYIIEEKTTIGGKNEK